ncbi:MAG: alpha/beta hydrolase [Desulfobacterales bacterium]
MAERAVRIPCGEIELEGRLAEADGSRAALVLHPHPLYGGDMDTAVVLALARLFHRAGFRVLRFNFRGVGESGGRHGGGGPERLDVASARDWLRAGGAEEIWAAGYSFGAWVLAGAPEGFAGLILVSPPVALLDFGSPSPLPALRLVVTGERDPIAPARRIAPLVPLWNPDAAFTVIPGADHFYTGTLGKLTEAAARALRPRREGPDFGLSAGPDPTDRRA